MCAGGGEICVNCGGVYVSVGVGCVGEGGVYVCVLVGVRVGNVWC